MTLRKTPLALAGIAAASLALGQPAFAADVARAPSPSADSEHLAGMNSGAWIGIAAVLAVAIYAIIDSSNDNDRPASP